MQNGFLLCKFGKFLHEPHRRCNAEGLTFPQKGENVLRSSMKPENCFLGAQRNVISAVKLFVAMPPRDVGTFF